MNTVLFACLAAGGLLFGGLLAHRTSGGAQLAQTFAGGLLLALITVDLMPTALADGRHAGWSPVLVLAGFALVGAAALLLLTRGSVVPRGSGVLLGSVMPRSSVSPQGSVVIRGSVLPRFAAVPRGCCAPASGDFSSVGIALHGVLEGMVLGLGLGVDSAAGPVLLCAFCLHKAGEGFALRVSLRASGTRPGRVRLWMGTAAAAPVLGAAIGRLVVPPERAVPLLTAALAGILVAVAVTMVSPSVLRRPLARPALNSWASLIAGASLMGIVTTVAG